jgi:hypothetical protein
MGKSLELDCFVLPMFFPSGPEFMKLGRLAIFPHVNIVYRGLFRWLESTI